VSNPLLVLDRINTFYGAVQAHFDLSLEVGEGRIVSLLGGNASGKSTTMKVIVGLLAPRSGTITFDGARIDGWPTHRVIRAGIRLRAGSAPHLPFERICSWEPIRAPTAELSPETSIGCSRFSPGLPNQRAGVLSGGEQQMVAMARALMGRPQLICMDEPTMGLSPLFVDRVLELIAEINRQGLTVFMVEQNANLALQIAHEGYVLQTGRIVLQGSAAQFA
jgi:branched-chain amino acid transport system ATP-binding protein